MKKQNCTLIDFIQPDFTFNDQRGGLVQLFREGWSQVNYIYSEAGSFRGGHYHKENKELFFIISGQIELELTCLVSKKNECINIGSGDMFVISKNISHSFNFKTECQLISAYDLGVERDAGMDIHQG